MYTDSCLGSGRTQRQIMQLRNWRIPIVAALVTTLLGAALIFFAVPQSKLQWRVELLHMKVKGETPELEWADVLVGMLPYNLIERRRRVSSMEWGLRGSVSVRDLEEDGPCPVLWDTPLGQFWGRIDDRQSLTIIVKEQLEKRIYDRDPAVVRNGDIVLDVGGHLGTFTRFALNKGARLVVAFEPEPINIACFKKSLLNEIRTGKVILVEAAAWDSSGTLSFELGPGVRSYAGRVVSDGGFTVRAVTIDETVERLGLDRVDFIKMDIEGSERAAAAGARETIARFGPRMALCVYHKEDDPEVIPRIVLDARPDYRLIRTTKQAYFGPGTQ